MAQGRVDYLQDTTAQARAILCPDIIVSLHWYVFVLRTDFSRLHCA